MRHQHRNLPARTARRAGRILAASLLGSLAAWVPARASAQLAPPIRLELSAGAGSLQPGTDLARGPDVLGGATRLGGGLALCVTAALQLVGGLGVEAQALWAPNAALEDPGGTHEGNADWSALSLDAVFRPPLPILSSLLEPFVGAGLGVRRLTPHPGPATLPVVNGTPPAVVLSDSSARSDFAVEALVGTYLKLPGLWRLRAELRDYVTSFSDAGDARLQNDLAVLGALVLRVP